MILRNPRIRPAADQGRDQWRENPHQVATHHLLYYILIRLCGRLRRLFAYSLNPSIGSKFIVKHGHIITNDKLDTVLPVVKVPLTAGISSNGLFICLLRINKYETHSCHTM